MSWVSSATSSRYDAIQPGDAVSAELELGPVDAHEGRAAAAEHLRRLTPGPAPSKRVARPLVLGTLLLLGIAIAILSSLGDDFKNTTSLAPGEFSKFWWAPGSYGPCPTLPKRMGGVARAPIYLSVNQAWHCLDENKDGVLSDYELPVGSTISGVPKFEFIDRMRRSRESLSEGLPEAAEKVKAWEETLLQWSPSGMESPLLAPKTTQDSEARSAFQFPVYSAADAAIGVVHDLFTFGSPSVVLGGMLRNPARADGCFPGLRTYTRGAHLNKDFDIRFFVTDPVAYLLSGLGFHHPKMSVLTANEASPLHSGFSTCGDSWNGPQGDLFFWFEGHTQNVYSKVLHELAGVLGAWGKLYSVTESLDSSVPSSERCDAHPKCAALFAAANASEAEKESNCCPDASGAMRSCCSSVVHSIDKFEVEEPQFIVGRFVQVTKDLNELKESFIQVAYPYHNGMENMLNEIFPITNIPAPGIVGLPSIDGSDDGVWYFPVSVLHVVPPEVAHHMEPKVVGRRLEPESLQEKKSLVAKAVTYQELGVLSYTDSDIVQQMRAEDWDTVLVSRVLPKRNITGISPQMSIFQNPESLDCTVVVSVERPLGLQNSLDSMLEDEFLDNRPILARSLYEWWEILAGYTKRVSSGTEALWNPKAKAMSEFVNIEQKKMPTGECYLTTPFGTRPCNSTNSKQIEAIEHVRRTREWCGIEGVQVHFADALEALTSSADYQREVPDRLAQCGHTTASGLDIGGALASLWMACVNSRPKEGDVGFEAWSNSTWKWHPDGALKMEPYVASPSEVQDSYLVKHKKTGKVLEVVGSTREFHQEEAKLTLAEIGDDKMHHWFLTPEGFLRNLMSRKCLGVVGSEGQTDIGTYLNRQVETQDCQYSTANTMQAWNFTRQGFLVNQYTTLCLSVDMTLVTCPQTDQLWQLKSDGFIVNQLSGHCLDVSGDPGTENGDKIVLWPCEYDLEKSDQRWTYTAEGFLKNVKSGKCLDIEHISGVTREEQSKAVLWDCVGTLELPVAQVWDRDFSGYLTNRMTGRCLGVQGRTVISQGAQVGLDACRKFVGAQSSNLWEYRPTGEIVNRGILERYAGMCLAELEGGKLEVVPCNQQQRQLWTVTEAGELRPAWGRHFCLSEEPGDAISVRDCRNGTARKPTKWYLTSDHFLVNRASKRCLDVPSDDPSTLRQNYCRMTDQHWRVPEEGRQGQVKSALSGMCLELVGGIPENLAEGAEAQIWECLSDPVGSDQMWVHHDDGRLSNALSGKCLGIRGYPYSDKRLVLQACNTTDNNQIWYESKAGFLRNFGTDLCMDVDGVASHKDGKRVGAFSCERGGDWSDQLWELEKVSSRADFSVKAALAPPGRFRVALDPSEARGAGADEVREKGYLGFAGEFVTTGKEVYWIYRNYKHLVEPSNDCSRCQCKSRLIMVEQSTIDEAVEGKPYDCKLQDMANALDGFSLRGHSAVTSEQAAMQIGVGRFISAGRNVYWDYSGKKHEVQPGIGCDACGCDKNIVLVSNEDLVAVPTGMPFQCEMAGIAAYGAHFERK